MLFRIARKNVIIYLKKKKKFWLITCSSISFVCSPLSIRFVLSKQASMTPSSS